VAQRSWRVDHRNRIVEDRSERGRGRFIASRGRFLAARFRDPLALAHRAGVTSVAESAGRASSSWRTHRRGPMAAAKATIDHEIIRVWVESRGGRPSCVKGTGRDDDPGIVRIAYSDDTGHVALEPI